MIKIEKEAIEQVFKRICGRYVYWYNIKYQRTGHLFQDRFKSEPVEDESYLITVIRYIHQNPQKAGLCDSLEDYLYSSFNEYLTAPKITDVEFVLQMMTKNEFVRYSYEANTDKCLEIDACIKVRVTDEQARRIIEKHSKCATVAEIQRLDSKSRNEFIEILNKTVCQ